MKQRRPTALSFAVSGLCAWLAAGPAGAQAPAAAPAGKAAAADCTGDNLLAGKTPTEAQDIQRGTAIVTDGVVGPEGAAWDAPVAVTFGGGGALTYDLGKPRSVGALYIQADANDTYKVSGSIDGVPGSFTALGEVDNVVDRAGHGLRGRTLALPTTPVRYLRVAAGVGDSLFSISELTAHCRAPSPFPPTLRVDGAAASPTAAPRATGATPTTARPTEPTGPLGQLGPVLVVVLILLSAWQLAGRGGGAGPRWTTEAALRLLFVASGAAALIYEVVWLHLLRLVIGASALSVGIVLAAFMGGMFLGSLLFSRFVSRASNPLQVYARLEIGIGVFGLLMPLLLPVVRFVYLGLVGYGALGIALRALIAAVMLLPPTALMGATLPAIARRYAADRQGTSTLAGLYAANTTGAVLGSLLAAFYLLAVWDVWVATVAAAALNFAVGWYAARLARQAPARPEAPAEAPAAAPVDPGAARLVPFVYVAVGLSGLTALGAQVLWTRILTLLFGATVYAFAIILAVFLAGLGGGSALAAYLLRKGASPLRGLAFSQIALVPALLLAGHLLVRVLPYASPSAWIPVNALHTLHVFRAIEIVLPAAVLWGMSFPYALAAAAASHRDPGQSSGRVYAANTVGAILGAVGVSFWIIPVWGTAGAAQALVLIAAVSAAALLYALARPATAAADRPPVPVWTAGAALAAGVVAALAMPGLSTVWKAHGRYIWWVDPGDQYPYVAEGAASTVAVHVAPNGYRNFHVSGRVEASNNPNDLRTERLIGHLSAMAHPNPESVLVVGLGAGVSAGALSLYPQIKRIVICEIEPRVAGAARQFAPENYAVLDDPRVQVVYDDARHFLATTREKFDIITSDPIHPWVRGNSVLFSREYYAIVRSKLKPGGIASQWVPLYETDELAIRIQMRTFMDAFPNGTLWNTLTTGKGYDVVLVGREEPLRLDLAALQARLDRNPRLKRSFEDVKINDILDLMGFYGTNGRDMAAWLGDAPINRDFSLKLEYISGLALNRKEADPIYEHMIAGRSYPEQMFITTPATHANLRKRLGRK
jgi:spermidine synthase